MQFIPRKRSFEKTVALDGRVRVTVSTNRNKTDVRVTVEDNGFGLDAKNWEAFTTTDTDNKIQIGGKGVGRLLWLDCFKEIEICSVFRDEDEFRKRAFRFVLCPENQIQGLRDEPAGASANTTFVVHFKGLQENGIS